MNPYLCKIEGCTSKARQRGRCKKHYRQWRRENPVVSLHREPENRKPYSINEYRYLWEVRMKRRILCDEWQTLTIFAAAVHPMPKPRGDYKLCRLNPKLPFGPDNFSWRKKVVMLPGETKKEYAARSRLETIARNPTFERDRMLMRNYGLTREQFDEILNSQDHKCAICARPEMSLSRVQKGKRLAVDHCHDTGIIRGLLCFECNTSIGKMGDSPERLEAAARYIRSHQVPKLKVV